MYSDKISVFENFQSKPETITLLHWLKACKKGSRFVKQVLEYRHFLNDLIEKGYLLDEAKKELENIGKDRLKTSLPLATVGALCKDGRKLENVVTRTGWISLDIDAKDNPHLTDAEHIRDEVAKIKNVAFSGLSTGGRGVWALVKVSEPNRQAEHFEALQADFKRFGITLDSSKGKNPNDARFYSYDPGAIIKESFTVYKKLPPSNPPIKNRTPKTPIPVNGSKKCSRYAETAFTNEIEILSLATKGIRNETLFKSSASLAELVAGGMLDEYNVRQALRQTSLAIGLKQREISPTINSGFKTGFKNPRTPDSIGRNSLRINHARRRDSAENRIYEGRKSAPYGFNPYTGEIFDKRGYPASWDDIQISN